MSPIRLISVEEAQARLAVAVGLRPADGMSDRPADQVIAECLRRALCWLTSGGRTGQAEPVYVTSLTNHVREQLSPLWPTLHRSRNKRPSQAEQQLEGDTQPDPIRRVLQALSDLREVEHVGEGYWLPTPVRLVELPAQDAILVIGGLDTAELRRVLHPSVQVLWITRTLPRAALEPATLEDRSLWQTLPDYLGDPPPSLAEWTTGLLERAARSLTTSAAGYTRFEVYAPKVQGSRLQYFRWMPVEQFSKLPEGLALCRTTERYQLGPRRYWLGTIAAFRGEAGADKEYTVDSKDVLRLQYGIDLRQTFPTRVLVRQRGEDVLVQFENFLPPEERRLLIAFGKEESETPGRLPLVYRFQQQHFGLIQQRVIEGLGLAVRTG